MSAPVTIEIIRDDAAMRAALSVRFAVFVQEQGVPLEEEVDGFDERPGERDDVVHVLARRGLAPLGTARLLLPDRSEADAHPEPHIGRVAVLEAERRTGVGRDLMAALHAEALRRGHRAVVLSAQLHALPFYERLGYIARGPVYLDAGIEHRKARIEL